MVDWRDGGSQANSGKSSRREASRGSCGVRGTDVDPPILRWSLDAPGGIILGVVGYQFSYQSLRFFGGLHDADIDEIPGMETLAVCRCQAQARARFRP